MGYLSGLKDKVGKVDCLFISKGSDIEVILKNHYAATSAGDKGAINIYKDDNFFIRCEALRSFNVLDRKTYTSMSAAIKWTDKWLKKIK